MKPDDFSGNAKIIIDQLISIHGPSVAFRLYGVIEYARQNPNLELRDAKLLWRDAELLKEAGLYPAALRPNQLSEWSRFLFSVNFKAALAIGKLVPIKSLVGEVSEKEMAAAREMLRNYSGLKGLDDDIEQPHPAWAKSPK
jgi:hypothetical protein